MLVDLTVVLLLVLLNGYFAMAEMAVVSSRKARLQQIAEQSAGARAAIRLIDEPTRFLSTVQVGITLIGVLAGAFSGATIAARLGDWLEQFPAIAPYHHAAALGIVVAAIAYLSLIIGELVPKRLALARPERIAARVARPMRLIAALGAPLVTFLAWSSDTVLRLLRLHGASSPAVTEEEIRHLVREGALAGAIETIERDMVDRIFRLGDKLVRDIMTPRTQIVWLDAEAPLAENFERMRKTPHSRYPVMGGDGVVGIVRLKDLLGQLGEERSVDLFSTMREPLFVPETTPAMKVLDTFKAADVRIALVVDEYGDVQGMVTPSDILGAVVGEEALASATGPKPVTRRDDGSYLIDGMYPADELKTLLQLQRLPGEDEHDFSTIAGMMIARFGRIPEAGDHFAWQNTRFEVVDMDGPRIDKVLVAPPFRPDEEP